MRMLATSASCAADPNRLHRQLISVSARYYVYRSQRSLGERQRDWHREPADDRPWLVSVEHRIAVRVHDLETPCPKVSGNLNVVGRLDLEEGARQLRAWGARPRSR